VASARINPRPLASAPRVRRQSAYSGPEINATTSVSTAPIGRGGMQRAWPQDHGNGIRCVFHVVLLMEAERHCCASPRSRTQPVSGALRADPAEFKSMACRTGKGDSFDVFLKKKSKLCGGNQFVHGHIKNDVWHLSRMGFQGERAGGIPAFSAPFPSRRNTTSNTARPLFDNAIKRKMPAMLSKGGWIFDKFRVYYCR
jgi:hypothetical protein